MTRRTLAVFAAVAFLVAVAGYSQSTARLVSNIPFDFYIGSKVLPAGEYEVRPGVASGAVLFRSIDQNAAVIALTNSKQASRAPKEAKLVFNRYGNSYFLAEIWHPNIDRGYQLPKSKTEREMARNAPGIQLAFVRAMVR